MFKNKFIALIILTSALFIACGETKEKEEKSDETIVFGETKVEVYYFHGDRRCPNCNAIERVAKNLVNEEYIDNEDVKFFVINFEKAENKEIAQKYNITWSSLVIASEEQSIDLTMEAFQYSMTNPDFLRNEINEVINDFL